MYCTHNLHYICVLPNQTQPGQYFCGQLIHGSDDRPSAGGPSLEISQLPCHASGPLWPKGRLVSERCVPGQLTRYADDGLDAGELVSFKQLGCVRADWVKGEEGRCKVARRCGSFQLLDRSFSVRPSTPIQYLGSLHHVTPLPSPLLVSSRSIERLPVLLPR